METLKAISKFIKKATPSAVESALAAFFSYYFLDFIIGYIKWKRQ